MATIGKSMRKNYVDIDISQSTENDWGINYMYRHEISIKQESQIRTPVRLKGYKRYTHTLRNNSCVGRVIYKLEEQMGLGHKIKSESYVKVVVFYWAHDNMNYLPLLVGFSREINDEDKYEYYLKSSYTEENTAWIKDGTINRNGSNLAVKLNEISNNLKHFVTIDIYATNQYFFNGKHTTPKMNEDVRISVNIYTVDFNYKKYTHSLSSGGFMNIMTIRANSKGVPFRERHISEKCLCASFYHWSGNDDMSTPLLLELTYSSDEKNKSKFFKLEDGAWVCHESISDNPLGYLRKLNCEINKAHCMDFTHQENYRCKSCGIQIQVVPCDQQEGDYSVFRQVIRSEKVNYNAKNRFSIASFQYDGCTQSGIESSKGVKEVRLFFYPRHGGDPLLMYYSLEGEKKWYKADPISANKWNELKESDRPSGDSDERVLSLLICSHSPPIAVDIKEGVSIENGKYITYPYTSENINETISVLRNDLEGSYHCFVHSVRGKDSFRIHSLSYGDFTLENTKCSDILTEVTVFYWCNDKDYEKPLLIELKLKNGRYKYLDRKAANSNTWTFCNKGNTCQLTGSALTKKLDCVVNRDFASLSTIMIDTLVTVIFGLGMICFAIHEGINAVTNPKRSLTYKLISLCKKRL
ncbi:hypothetical protein BEWA_023060 [Theileria equi strain WA]|uniref:Uncharacterized protein n=1 Tax=Theileria equi strain WA TaxID=1537102 RepID=L0AW54_THEEQ|nr:hypothetical protein BEWA_023060 [Theileria equi strain WA]AFZ79458.1 hypothetical protein BEWA_023060 [Theileria equi strain WA]|eukprot:XP_004829124.1 hypothetical protein BEWA_023060 [Theileria equi strain WA]